MTVAALPSTVTYMENGVTVNFAVPFRFKSAGDLVVSRIIAGVETVLALGVDYTVTDGNTDAGGTLTRSGATTGGKLRIERKTVREQPMEYTPNGTFPAKSHEDALDRQMLISQEQGDQIDSLDVRALTVPIGDQIGLLPPAAERIGKFVGFGADPSKPLALSGTGTDPAMRSDLARSLGAALVGFSYDVDYGHGTIGRKLQQSVNPMDPPFNCKFDGITDDTDGFQAACNMVMASLNTRSLYIPIGVCRLTRTITLPRTIGMMGEDCSPYNGFLAPNSDHRGKGSWLFFDHSGKGLTFQGDGPIAGAQIIGVGFYRKQPAPAPGWQPYDHDYDIYLNSCDMHLDRITFLNATKGVCLDNGNYGRLTIGLMRGQIMKVGIYVRESYDRSSADNLHFWSIWQDNEYVLSYQRENYDALLFDRCDGFSISALFAIHTRSGIHFAESSLGAPSIITVASAYIDYSKYGLLFDPNVVNGASVSVGDLICNGAGADASNGLAIFGSQNRVNIAFLHTVGSKQNAVRIVGGVENHVTITQAYVNQYNESNSAFPAFECAANNHLNVMSAYFEGSAHPGIPVGYGAPRYGGAGEILQPGVSGAPGSAGTILDDLGSSIAAGISQRAATAALNDISAGVTAARADFSRDTVEFYSAAPDPAAAAVAATAPYKELRYRGASYSPPSRILAPGVLLSGNGATFASNTPAALTDNVAKVGEWRALYMAEAGGSTIGSANESTTFISAYAAPTSSGEAYQKNALYVRMVTADPSDGITTYRDTVAIQGQALSVAGNMQARLWGGHSYAAIQPGSDGYAVGHEIEIYNNASVVTTFGTGFEKIGLHVVARDGTATAAVKLTGYQGNQFAHGIFAFTSDITPGGDFLRLSDDFIVSRTGQVGIGAGVASAALPTGVAFTAIGTAIASSLFQASDATGASFSQYLRPSTLAYSAGLDNQSQEYRICARQGLAGNYKIRAGAAGVGFNGAAPVTPTLTFSKSGSATTAFTAVVSALATLGLVTDSTT